MAKLCLVPALLWSAPFCPALLCPALRHSAPARPALSCSGCFGCFDFFSHLFFSSFLAFADNHCVLCRSAPLLAKHAAEVALVIRNSKKQAALFARQSANTTAAATTHISLTSPPSQPSHALPPSSTIHAAGLLSFGNQVAADSPVQTPATAVGADATLATDAAVTRAEVPLPEAAAAAVPQAAVTEVIKQKPESTGVFSQSAAAGLRQASAIKPKALKPIAMAPAASAFGRSQPKRPALAQSTPVPQPSNPELTAMHPISQPLAAMSQQMGVNQPAEISQLNSDQQPSSISKDTAAQSQLDEEDDSRENSSSVPMTTATAAPAAPSSSASVQSSVAKAEVTRQQPSAKASAFIKQARAIPQIRAAAGGPFGAAPQQETAAGLPQSQGILAADAELSRPPPHELDLDAVNRLRAQFTLPFAVAPAEERLAAAKAGKRQQPEGQEPIGQGTPDGPGNGSSTAKGVRAVVDALQAEKPSNSNYATEPASKKQKGISFSNWFLFKQLGL